MTRDTTRVGFCCCLVLLCSFQAAEAQVFSLDDSMVSPFTTPVAPVPFAPLGLGYGTGAEDPFGGLGFPGFAPSPSLFSAAGVLIEGDIAAVGAAFPGLPELNTISPIDAFYGTGLVQGVNALSNNSLPPSGTPLNLFFSVDRFSFGVAASGVGIEAGLGQQPGDIYVSSSAFPDPAGLVGLPAAGGYIGPLTPPAPGTNTLVFDESAFELTVVGAPGVLTAPGVAVPFPTPQPAVGAPASHDNIDGFEFRFIDTTGDAVEDIDYFYSINPDQALAGQLASGGAPFDSGDIWYTPAGAGGASFLYAPGAAMGLAPMPVIYPPALGPPPPPPYANDVDALVVWDAFGDGIATPGFDFALFSLAPGSFDLAAFGTGPDDIFFTDFSGTYGLYAAAVDLGLTGFDNIDALEVAIPGDANLDGAVTFLDVSVLSAFFGALGGGWLGADFDGDGVTGFLDVSILSSTFAATTGAITTVPEPGSLVLIATSMVGLGWTRRRPKVSH